MSIARRFLGTGVELEPFIFEITTTMPNTVVTLPFVDVAGYSFNCEVDWDDSSTSTITAFDDLDRIHTYTSAGTYSIKISGNCPGFRVSNGSLAPLVTEITQWGNVGLKRLNFHGCFNVISLPSDASGFSTVIDFSSGFRSTGITSIPSDLFQYATSVSIFSDVFSFTPITSIPSGLFDNSVNATSFGSAFSGCGLITSIPSGLFDNCTNVVNFSGTFRRCNSLTGIPLTLFDASAPPSPTSSVTTTFESVFEMSVTNSMDGNAPALWTRIPEPFGDKAFRNCLGLDNYAAIPANWK
jgi:hypothetical protein